MYIHFPRPSPFIDMSLAVLPNKFFLENCRPDLTEVPTHGVLEVGTNLENANIVLKECSNLNSPTGNSIQLDPFENHYKPASVRRCTTWHLDTEKSLTSNILRSAIAEMNTIFNYNLSNILEIMYVEYPVGGFYKMHVDVGDNMNACRKISITWNLNPQEYQGGELSFYQPMTEKGFISYKSPADTIVGFTSFLNHEVKPVTHGTRKAIVAFVGGEAWR